MTIDLSNEGEAAQVKVLHVDMQTDGIEMLMDYSTLEEDGELSIQVDATNWTLGQHVIHILTDGEAASHIITKF